MTGLILGSSSAYRRELLQRLRLPFSSESPDVDESQIKALGLPPLETAQQLAREKARAVAARHPDDVVIGSDQVAALDDEVLDKPGTAERAVDQLRRLRGREHRLMTAVALVRDERLIEFHDITRLTMRDLSDREIERYVAAEQPLDCAGSYRIEGLGITLFERIDTRDQTAIVGLPLLRLSEALRALGFPLP